MSITRKSLIALAIITVIVLSLFYFASYLTQKEVHPTIIVDGVTWKQVLYWNFRNGLYPKGWGWGDWSLVDETLEGRDLEGDISVYFFPFSHGGDFILETEVKFIEGAESHDVEAQLLTRDSDKINFESGMVAFANENKVTVRHMANKIDYVYVTFDVDMNITHRVRYPMRFMICNGMVKAFLNGTEVYASEDKYPVGEYYEPHLAVGYGIARFTFVSIYVGESTALETLEHPWAIFFSASYHSKLSTKDSARVLDKDEPANLVRSEMQASGNDKPT